MPLILSLPPPRGPTSFPPPASSSRPGFFPAVGLLLAPQLLPLRWPSRRVPASSPPERPTTRSGRHIPMTPPATAPGPRHHPARGTPSPGAADPCTTSSGDDPRHHSASFRWGIHGHYASPIPPPQAGHIHNDQTGCPAPQPPVCTPPSASVHYPRLPHQVAARATRCRILLRSLPCRGSSGTQEDGCPGAVRPGFDAMLFCS